MSMKIVLEQPAKVQLTTARRMLLLLIRVRPPTTEPTITITAKKK
ncbi:hypothetical protein [Fuerstiella marisgermanici]|nr:hypothetical protein [Fuerstiella marisgermanici]